MSLPAALPPIPPNIAAIAAPQLIGSLLNYCLYGVLCVQVYIYRISFPDDKREIKALVYSVFLFETVNTCLNAADIYYWFASGYGNVLRFQDPHYSWFYTPVMDSIMSLIVQLFFCYRIWIIKKSSLWWCILIAAVSVTQAIGGIIGGVKAHLQTDVAKRSQQTAEVYLWLVGDAVADIMIAVTMTIALLRARGELHRQTNDIVGRIVRLTVETNTLSALIAIISMILFAGVPNTTYFIATTLFLGKIYANTLLVTFNNRAFINKGSSNHASSADMSRTGRSFGSGLAFSERSTIVTSNLSPNNVKITTQSFTDRSVGRVDDIGLDTMQTNGSHKLIHIAPLDV